MFTLYFIFILEFIKQKRADFTLEKCFDTINEIKKFSKSNDFNEEITLNKNRNITLKLVSSNQTYENDDANKVEIVVTDK